MENIFYVYEWIRLDTNEPFYVGKGRGNRAYSLKDRNKHFHNIVNKVGLENCAVVILHDNLTNDEACEIECWYIHQYKYLGPYNITNLTDGGEGFAGTHTDESRRKMSESHKREVLSEETRKKMSEAQWLKGKGYLISGENHPMWGRENRWGKHSEETRRKMSKAHTGKNHSEEARRKMSKAHKGKKFSEETRRKISEALQGENNPLAKAIILIFPDGTEKEFRTIKDASLYLGGVSGNCSTANAIHNLLKGWIPTKRSKWYGYSAMYLEDYEKKLIS